MSRKEPRQERGQSRNEVERAPVARRGRSRARSLPGKRRRLVKKIQTKGSDCAQLVWPREALRKAGPVRRGAGGQLEWDG